MAALEEAVLAFLLDGEGAAELIEFQTSADAWEGALQLLQSENQKVRLTIRRWGGVWEGFWEDSSIIVDVCFETF